MYENDYMYAIERSPEYLAHYGIRGMKWGVRKAIESGNSAKLSKQYAKAQKKLAKLEKRAAKSGKYARRAALMGAGAAVAGGLAAAGTGGVSTAMTKIGAHGGQAMIGAGRGLSRAGSGLSKALYNAGKATGSKTLKKLGAHGGQAMIGAGNAIARAGSGMSTGMYTAGKAVRTWGNSNSIGNAIKTGSRELSNNIGQGLAGDAYRGVNKALFKSGHGSIVSQTDKLGKISNNTIARVGAGAIGAGLAIGAARNAYKAATAKKKAEKFRNAMNESFKGTKYANGGNGGNRQGKKRRR